MEKRTLGNTGIEVSALCLGTDLFGSKRDAATSNQLMDFFRSKGGTFLDTGNFYAAWLEGYVGGESETVIGNWMKDRGCRNEMVVATKLGFDYPGSQGGLSATEIEQECEKSLRRLQTDHLDLYYSHIDDRKTPLEETMEAFHRLVTAGKVRALGASNLLGWRIAEASRLAIARGWTPYSAVEQRYTYARPHYGASFGPQIFLNEDLKDFARATGTTLVGYSMLLSGVYSRGASALPVQFSGVDTEKRCAVLSEVAAEVGASVNQIIIAWAGQSDPPVLPIIAGSSVGQLDENIRALDIRLSEAQMKRLNEAGNLEVETGWMQS